MTQLEIFCVIFILLNCVLFGLRSSLAPVVTRLFNNANRSQPAIPQLTVALTQRTLALMGAINAAATVILLIVLQFVPQN